MPETLLSVLWVLVCCVVVLGLAFWFTKYVAGRGKLGGMGAVGGGEHIKVLDQLSLGKDQRLVVVRTGGRYLLLGVTAAGISCLAEFTPEEAEQWRVLEAARTQQGAPTFLETLRQALGKRGGGEGL